MQELGKRNLFISEFIVGSDYKSYNQFEGIIGCVLPKPKQVKCIKTLTQWIYFKENDYGMRNYRLENTQFIAFLHIIDLQLLVENLNELVIKYKQNYPHSKKKDFIEYYFHSTLLIIEKIIKIHNWNFIPYGLPSSIVNEYNIYYCDEISKGKIVDIIIEQPKDIDWFKQLYIKIIELLNKLDFDCINSESDLIPLLQSRVEKGQNIYEAKPVLKPEAVQTVFEIIKDFFIIEQQPELKKILETGDKVNEKLLFRDAGNRLTDTFKKLIEHDFITGCQKQDLINWIISNFNFISQKNSKAFIYDTVEKTISRNSFPCKSPLIEINNGIIQKFEKPRIKKYSK